MGSKRFARSTLCILLRGLVVLPSSSVLRFFLACGRHRFPRLSEAKPDQAIALKTPPRNLCKSIARA
jgi:hypothetical protein